MRKNNNIQILILLFVSLSVVSCNRQKSPEYPSGEISQREVKKISEAEIAKKALQIGHEISGKTQKVLGETLKKSVQNDGFEAAIRFCNLNAYPLVDSLKELYHADIRRVTFKFRNPLDKPDSIETVVLNAYEYVKNDTSALKENIQDIGKDTVLYTRPIIVQNGLCLICHGKPETGFTDKYARVLDELYPIDHARGYNLGDLRGMWSIRIPKKTIIESF